MVNNISELKELILWCKENKLKSVSINGISFELSELAHVENIQGLTTESHLEQKEINANTENRQSESNSEEDLLFWSSN